MTDINLLQDTKATGDAGKSKKSAPSKIEYTKPDEHKGIDRPLMKPSGVVLWFRSLFRKRTPAPKPSAPPPVRPKEPKFGSALKEPEDIFSNIDVPDMVLMQRRAPDSDRRPPSPLGTRIVQEAAGRTTEVVRQKQPQKPVTVTASPEPVIEGGPLRMPAVPAPPSSIRPPVPKPEPVPAPPPTPKPFERQKPLQRGKQPFGLKKKDDETREPNEEFEGVNLLPEELVTTFNPRKKLMTLGFAALAAALFVGIIDVGLVLWKDTQVKKTAEKRTEVEQVIQRIKSLEPDQKKAIAFKAENDAMHLLFKRHMYWTKFLALFERSTLPEIYYPAGIQVASGGNLTLTGSAPDLPSILQQVAMYQQATDLIVSAAVNTLSYDSKSTRYTFIIELTFNPSSYYDPPAELSRTATTGGAQ